MTEGATPFPPRRAIVACLALFASIGAFLPRARAAVEAPDAALVDRETQLKATSEAKIQKDILDPILGPGKGMVFVDVELEQVTQKQEANKQGTGLAQSYKEKNQPGGAFGIGGDPNSQFILPGVPQPKFLSRLHPGGGAPPEQAQQQQAAQAKEVSEQKLSVKTLVKKFQITIIHDQTIGADKLEMVRQRLLDAFAKYEVTPDRILFRPTHFASTWLDDLKNPKVYVPLAFAALLLLFLLYLFGPFTAMANRMIEAMKERGQTEVNVDSKFEQGQQQPGAMALAGIEGEFGELGRKKEEEEDEEMKKFEPFAYINEENIKRLAYLLRHEEPWVAAVVLAYLKPDFGHMILQALPLELQAKVAIETAMIRQLSREQVMAIDEQIKEKVNFVLGGVGHLLQMIEDSDEATRQNLLEFLKNERPAVFERIRKALVLFEDIPGFQDRDVQTIIRALKTENMARALSGAAPEVVDKFLANMSTGAASLLKEEMEYTHDMTPAQIDEERHKIMSIVKMLENEGKVHVREKLDDFALEGLEDATGLTPRPGKISLPGAAGAALATPAASPAQAKPMMQEAVAHLQAGRYAECLAVANEALRLDPELWQALSFMGYAAYSLGRVEEAVGYYERYYDRSRDPALRDWLDALKASIGKGGTRNG